MRRLKTYPALASVKLPASAVVLGVHDRGPDQAVALLASYDDVDDETAERRFAVLRSGDAVWVEDPGYAPGARVFELEGLRVVPVDVDHEGLSVASGMARAPRARAAYVTPSHQFPLGVTMSLARRLELLRWAATGSSASGMPCSIRPACRAAPSGSTSSLKS